jgi:hypothetical protein
MVESNIGKSGPLMLLVVAPTNKSRSKLQEIMAEEGALQSLANFSFTIKFSLKFRETSSESSRQASSKISI